MKYDINLFKETKVAQTTPSSLKITRIIAGFFILILLISVAFSFVEKNNYQTRVSQLQDQQSKLVSSLNQYKSRYANVALLNNRVASTNKILSQRLSYDKVLKVILSQSSDQLVFTNLDIQTKTVSISVSSTSLTPINSFTNNLKSLVNKKNTFSSVSQNKLNYDQISNTYSVTLNLYLL